MRACKFSAIQSRDYFDESYLQKLRDSAASSKIFLKHGWNEVDSGWSPLF